jgi:hypothetical protein
MKLTIDTDCIGDLIARDEQGRVLARRRRNCNPAAFHQIISDAECLGEIDWDNSRVAKPEEEQARE